MHETCGLLSNGEIQCWGSGVCEDDEIHAPLNTGKQAIAPDGRFSQVSLGYLHSCAVRTDGEVICWGLNDQGQLIAPDLSFEKVSVGEYHTCGLTDAAEIACWRSAPGVSLLTNVL